MKARRALDGEPRPRASDFWVMLLARIYAVFLLLCPRCGAPMRIIAFVTEGFHSPYLEHLGEPTKPPPVPAVRR